MKIVVLYGIPFLWDSINKSMYSVMQIVRADLVAGTVTFELSNGNTFTMTAAEAQSIFTIS